MKSSVPLLARKFRHACFALLLGAAITSSAETNLVISSFDFQATVVWSNALSGHTYALQRASALETGAWFNVPGFSNVAATNSVMKAVIPVSGPTGFYRVLDNGICCTNNGGADLSSPVVLGTICGDTSGNPILISGCGAAWYRVRIAECNASTSIDLAANIVLTHPAAGYNLFVYDSTLIPNAAFGQPQTICVAREDRTGDRTFDFIFEVRPSGVYGCDNWTLEVRRTSNVACLVFP